MYIDEIHIKIKKNAPHILIDFNYDSGQDYYYGRVEQEVIKKSREYNVDKIYITGDWFKQKKNDFTEFKEFLQACRAEDYEIMIYLNGDRMNQWGFDLNKLMFLVYCDYIHLHVGNYGRFYDDCKRTGNDSFYLNFKDKIVWY